MTKVLMAWRLGTGENKDYSVDLSSELNTGETISAFKIFADPSSDITIANASPMSGVIMFWASTPKAATAYYISIRATLSSGRIIENVVLLAGVQKVHGAEVATYP